MKFQVPPKGVFSLVFAALDGTANPTAVSELSPLSFQSRSVVFCFLCSAAASHATYSEQGCKCNGTARGASRPVCVGTGHRQARDAIPAGCHWAPIITNPLVFALAAATAFFVLIITPNSTTHKLPLGPTALTLLFFFLDVTEGLITCIIGYIGH